MDKKDLVTELIVEQFPELRETIRRLFEEDAQFQELCADYGEARRALAHWSAPAKGASQTTTEYRILVRELEQEILELLQERGDKAE
jgi:uncharacterized protein YdcH (DUF465 family)